MDISDLIEGKSLKADDLQGAEPTVVIARIERKQYENGEKLNISFQGKKKYLVSNTTNTKRIAFLYGKNTDEWIGKEIVLYAELVDFGGKMTNSIRVRAPAKRGLEDKGRYDTLKQTPPQEDNGEQEIPF